MQPAQPAAFAPPAKYALAPNALSSSPSRGGAPLQAAAPQQSERALLASASTMAQAYYNEGNFAMARRLLDSMAVSYRGEGWRSVLTTIILTALDCAVKLGDHVGAVGYSLELLGPNLLVTPQQKHLVMAQMTSLAFAITPLSTTVPPQQSVVDTVFEVDRRHAVLTASSHFSTVTGGAGSGSLLLKDAVVCVGEEFDLVLGVSVAFPQATNWQRMDVYFFCPTAATSAASGNGQQITISTAPPTSTGTGGVSSSAPYHLVLLPGGPSSSLANVEGALSLPPSDSSLPVLRPDARGHVYADLSFPPSIISGTGAAAYAAPPKSGASAFTFGPPPPAHVTNTLPKQATRFYRIRLKATVATTSHTPASVVAGSGAASAASSTTTTSSSSVANSSLFPTSLVCALSVPSPTGGAAPKALQFRADILPSKLSTSASSSSSSSGANEDPRTLVPVSVIEARAAARVEVEKKAKRKGLPLPIEEVPQPAQARGHTLRILPPHARAAVDLAHPGVGLVGEFMPLRLRVRSEGDQLSRAEIVAFASPIQVAPLASPGASPLNAALSSPSPSPRMTPSPSTESLSGLRDATDVAGVSLGPIDATTMPTTRNNTLLAVDTTLDAGQVRFYRLLPASSPSAEPIFEELSNGVLPGLPEEIAQQGQHDTLIYLRCMAVCTPIISFTLSYKSASTGQKLSVCSSLTSLAFKQPFKIRTKVFSDALSGLAPLPTQPQGAATPPQRLILGAPSLAHVELENVSGAALALDLLQLELSTKFFAPGVNAKSLRECVSPSAARTIKEASKYAPAASTPVGPRVCLAPGEKYTHLFQFVASVPGKTRYTPLHMRWARISPVLPVVGEDVSSSAPILFVTPPVTSRKDLTAFHILRAPLSVSFHAPASCVFGTTFRLEVRLTNETDQLHDVELQLLDTEGGGPLGGSGSNATQASTHTGHASAIKLVFSGPTRGLVKIRPHSREALVYTACPLECGAIPLPRIQLKVAGLATTVTTASTTNAATASNPAAASTNTTHAHLLMDPTDAGVIFVRPAAKQQPEGQAATAP